MQKTDMLSLYAYNRWANHRILRATERLSPSLLLASALVNHGSLRGTLVHISALDNRTNHMLFFIQSLE